jgi:putative CocE/NonD family hydrolase
VKLLIRKGGAGNYEWRQEKEWPLARTKWTRFYLGKGVLTDKAGKAASISYPASGMTKAGVASASWTSTALAGSLPDMGVYFVTKPMKKNLEITGPIVLVLWVSSSTEDMDVFATLRNIGPDGKDVFELGQQQQPVPVAKGWLRASHRALDEKLSLPWRPYHSHAKRVFLGKNEVVKLEVEIWPTSMVFAKGHHIRLDVQPRDGIGSAPYTHYSADYNSGTNTIYAGGSRASHLLLPVIPS